jgi:glycogen operon protein
MMLRAAQLTWHGVKLDQPDWGDNSHSVALDGVLEAKGLRFYLMLNAYWKPLEFALPKPPDNASWRRWIDTSLDSPHDIVPWESAPAIGEKPYRVEPRAVVMLFLSIQRSAD